MSLSAVPVGEPEGLVMPLISVITAVHKPVAEYLREAANSVAAQRLPEGWELEWLVQEDGDTPTARELAVGALYEANGAGLGTATTRNLALTEVKFVGLRGGSWAG
jgi:hypothetical protein